jgi:hypothetical protein
VRVSVRVRVREINNGGAIQRGIKGILQRGHYSVGNIGGIKETFAHTDIDEGEGEERERDR